MAGALALLATACRGAPPAGTAGAELDPGELQRRAESGDVSAQLALGLAYDLGREVPEDDAEAARWYARAARSGDPDARHALALLHE